MIRCGRFYLIEGGGPTGRLNLAINDFFGSQKFGQFLNGSSHCLASAHILRRFWFRINRIDMKLMLLTIHFGIKTADQTIPMQHG